MTVVCKRTIMDNGLWHVSIQNVVSTVPRSMLLSVLHGSKGWTLAFYQMEYSLAVAL